MHCFPTSSILTLKTIGEFQVVSAHAGS